MKVATSRFPYRRATRHDVGKTATRDTDAQQSGGRATS